MLGTDQNIAWQLLSFNLGIEAGQLIIVTCILTCTFIGLNILRFKRRDYMLFISGGIAALSIEMAIQRFPIILKKDNEKTVHVVCPDSNVGLT